MTIVAGDKIRVVVSIDADGDAVVQNILHYNAGAGVSESDTAVVAALTTHLIAAYNGLGVRWTNTYTGIDAIFSKRDTGTGLWEAIGVGDISTMVGTGGTGVLASGATAVIRKLTGNFGNQGRLFLSGILEADTTHNLLIAALMTALAVFAAVLDDDVAVTGGNMEPGWWSESILDIREWDAGTIINALIGYQRRRKPGVGI